MKAQLLFLSLLLGFGSLPAQTTLDATLVHDGLTREYRLYVPASYSAGTPAPLVFNLHGYGSDNLEQEFYGDFRPIADTAGFLIVHPNGTLDGSSERYWNAGFGTAIDDLGFLEALIDTLSADYSIDPLRVYSTGMSNGGFMSYHLACNSARFAAIASVTGSMSTGTFLTCSPSQSMPVMEIHGTSDAIVPYTGGSGIKPIADVLDYWATFNSCPTPPAISAVPNTVPSDGATADHHVYAPGDNDVTMEHFKINGGGHTWPGASVVIGVTCMDFDASAEIWRFFSQHTLITGRAQPEQVSGNLLLHPVPVADELHLSLSGGTLRSYVVLDLMGREMISASVNCESADVAVGSLAPGSYVLKASDGVREHVQRFVKW